MLLSRMVLGWNCRCVVVDNVESDALFDELRQLKCVGWFLCFVKKLSNLVMHERGIRIEERFKGSSTWL